VRADVRRVHQVLANLLGNALKFTPQGGTISVSVDSVEGIARFCVADTGVGIPAADVPHLFERFYQCEGTRSHHQGLGLGLEICKGLIELHGGRIWAESEPGRGSRFYFTLPTHAGDRQKV
jgi:signal transduction histidine kinase